MALEGYREEKHRHCVFFTKVNSRDVIEEEMNVRKEKDNFMMVFFKDILGKVLQNKLIKVMAIILFVSYLGCGIYFMKWIKEGLDYINIFPFHSYVVNYMLLHYRYFTEFPHRIHVVINQTLDYSDSAVQKGIDELLNSFETAPFMSDSSKSECWMREYLSFINEPISQISLRGYNLSDSKDFLDGFKNVFLNIKRARRFRKDVLFNSRGDKIIASRFFIQSHNVRNSSAEKYLLENIRRIADNSKYNVSVCNLWFVMYDQYLDVISTCVQTVGITAVIVCIIFTIFIPNLFCTLAVMVTVISIQVGVVGFMSVWNVNVDSVTMLILVMSTGFCVDYSSHICYAYVNCLQYDSNEKLRLSLYAVGYPILQGCFSTILGVFVLYFGESYLFVIFFKVIFLVMLFAAFHGLILLPVVLSVLDYTFSKKRKTNFNNNNEVVQMKRFISLERKHQIPFIDEE
ncbi:patched domain-containing protein 3-like [Centruroides vittatus]|uniref:patched domain-containing protein 3-like n=1 Tax=Centruroides vittatus TaxID=120091 RepID=UPI00350EE3AC